MRLAPYTSVAICLLVQAGLFGQTPGIAEPTPPPNGGTNKNTAQPFKSPVAIFRQLFSMTSQEQEKFLAEKYPTEKDEILAKVNEYKALKPDVRELKLKATELRWYLRPFFYAPLSQRPELLANVPEKDRKLVQDRLRYWDKLPIEAKKKMQTNEAMVVYFSLPAPERIFTIATNSDLLQKGIEKLQGMTEEQRQKTLDGFNQFFAFTPLEKEKILTSLSEPERLQLEKVLKQYANMPSSQRELCVHSFEKFASMSLEERQNFLRNAEVWKYMTSEQRQQCKELVEDLNSLPPLPEGVVNSDERQRKTSMKSPQPQ